MAQETEETQEEEEGQYETDDEDTRWKGLSTTISLLITFFYVALPAFASAGIVDLSAISQAWFLGLSLGFVAVLVYTFGGDTVQTAKEALGE